MFNQLLKFAQSTEHGDLMMLPGMATKAKSPAGWLDFDSVAFNSTDEKELVDFGISMIGRKTWLEDLRRTGHSEEFVFELDHGVRLRCKIASCNRGMSYTVNMRKIPNTIIPLENTGLPNSVLRLVNQGKGLIIVTGPTGAGKTTTLAAMIDYINRFKHQHVVTLERPIEYIHTNQKSIITQRDVPVDVPTFSEGLHDALRQSINTIMIGELTEKQAVETALMAGETGHLVLATMHTPSAKDAIMRLISFFGPDEGKQKLSVISSVLNGVVGQSLVPSVDKKSWELAYEVLINTPTIASAIYNNDMKAVTSQMEIASKDSQEGVFLLNAVLAAKVKSGRISIEAAMQATYDQPDLKRKI